MQLTLAGPDQTVDVSADAPVVEATRTQVAETVVSREIAGLPLNGRNYLDLAALTPGGDAHEPGRRTSASRRRPRCRGPASP